MADTPSQDAASDSTASGFSDPTQFASQITEPDGEEEPTELPEGSHECPVCLQTCIHPVQLPCSHIFCFLCIKGVANHSKRCALCRSEIPPDFLLRPMLLNTEDVLHTTQAFDGKYQWFYEGVRGWWQYDKRASMEIEDRYQKGERIFEMLIAGFLYVVDMENMIQYRRNTPSRRRRIKRDLVDIPDKKGVAGLSCRVNRPPKRTVGDGGEHGDAQAQTTASSQVRVGGRRGGGTSGGDSGMTASAMTNASQGASVVDQSTDGLQSASVTSVSNSEQLNHNRHHRTAISGSRLDQQVANAAGSHGTSQPVGVSDSGQPNLSATSNRPGSQSHPFGGGIPNYLDAADSLSNQQVDSTGDLVSAMTDRVSRLRLGSGNADVISSRVNQMNISANDPLENLQAIRVSREGIRVNSVTNANETSQAYSAHNQARSIPSASLSRETDSQSPPGGAARERGVGLISRRINQPCDSNVQKYPLSRSEVDGSSDSD